MPSAEEASAMPQPDAIKLAHKRLNELFERLAPRMERDVQQELFKGVQAILADVLQPIPDSNRFLSIAESAKLLFVSQPHVLKLLEQGKLELHHTAGDNQFVTELSLRDYQADQQAKVQAYKASAADED